MRIGEICTREVVFCKRNTSALEAAELMRKNHAGDLVVVDGPNGERVPVGIITDRDLVIEVMAMDVDPRAITVGDVMALELVVATEEEDVYQIIDRMNAKGVRRIPVVNAKGGLEGIVSFDDLVEFLGGTLIDLSRVVRRQESKELRTRR
jgi:CBS domain-containing protein